jgi:hypothetical protein
VTEAIIAQDLRKTYPREVLISAWLATRSLTRRLMTTHHDYIDEIDKRW